MMFKMSFPENNVTYYCSFQNKDKFSQSIYEITDTNNKILLTFLKGENILPLIKDVITQAVAVK